MPEAHQWAVGSNQYVKRPGAHGEPGRRPGRLAGPQSNQVDSCAVSWDRDALDFGAIQQTSTDRARHRFRGSLPTLIWNAAALEGNTYTLPEVQTLLDGVTLAGKRIEEGQQILALSEGYSLLDEMVGTGQFALEKQIADRLHGIVAQHEAIESGHFRGEGSAEGGGNVSLSNGGRTPGFDHGEGGVLLIERFAKTMGYLSALADPRERALGYFVSATRQQFYFDGNKRTARLMMSGELLANGYDAINVPFSRKYEFNLYLDHLFMHDDATPLMEFLISCGSAN